MKESSEHIENQQPPALASETAGRWVVDESDPEYEVWEAFDGMAVEDATTPKDTPMKETRWNPEGLANRCTAHRKNGDRCKRAAIAGGNVCRVHGGAAPAVQAAARVRLAMAADRMAANLLKIAVDDDAPDSVKLAATNSALDRAGLSAKTAVEVSVDPKPFEQLLAGMATMTGGSRAASRAERGVADTEDADWIEAEIVGMHAAEERAERPPMPRPVEEPAITDGAGSGLMSMEEALAALRATTPPPAAPAPRRRGTR
ncbi:hypothetical protein [Tsukamurella pseudospumae]|uniref:DUF222 domain-containing protein n=1 Tax=Tsukamurella pseudospumae TaxID=239498 RepID=A0A137YZC4_9ACTN|nr:hypothetical protein [Tsukamurella pseudospumae]KXO91296.1 hypothetical protein AXK61_07010 [Tsukamurella pseudospumae]